MMDLIDRPLTDLQRMALRCVAEGRCHSTYRRVGNRSFFMWLAYGRDVTVQLQALRKRRFVRYQPGGPVLTLAGAFELYFDAAEMLDQARPLLEITIWNANGHIVVHEFCEAQTATQEEIDTMVELIGGGIPARDAANIVQGAAE